MTLCSNCKKSIQTEHDMGDLMVCLRSLTKQNEKLQKVIDEIKEFTDNLSYSYIDHNKLKSILSKLDDKE